MTKVVIPARGGSKRIPRKNLLSVCGKPLIQWSIEAGLAAGFPVIVNTEDAEIGELAVSLGAGVHWRPEFLAGDRTTLEDTLTQMDMKGDMLILQPTSPLREPKHLTGMVEFAEGRACCSVVDFEDMFVWEKDGIGCNFDTERRLHTHYLIESGSMYLVNGKAIGRSRYGFGLVPMRYRMPKWTVFEIDTYADIPIVEGMMRQFMGVK